MKSETINQLQAELTKLGLSPNEYFMLYAIINKKEYPVGVNVDLYRSELWDKGLLTPNWEPTDKGRKVFDFPIDPDFDMNVERWRLMWPAGLLPHGKRARSDSRELKLKFKWFFENYDYSWSTIFTATEDYIHYYAETNYLYMRTSSYFIFKQTTPALRTSELSEWCDKVLNPDASDEGFDINV